MDKTGYEVYFANSGEEGIRKLKEISPDLIILDLILPKKSGFQIAKEIKAIDECNNIPIVVIWS